MTEITVTACAKVNLTLRVLNRLPNGYHTLRSLVCPLSLGDDLVISRAAQSGLSINCSFSGQLLEHINAAEGPDVEAVKTELEGPGNLINKAYRALGGEALGGLNVKLQKCVPLGAGLGGGSADAAAFLVGLNELLGLDLTEERLLETALRIGSDVPVLTLRRLAYMYGTGGRLSSVREIRPGSGLFSRYVGVILVKPPFPVPTPVAYRSLSPRPQITEEEFALEDPRTEDRALQELHCFGLEFATNGPIARERLTLSAEGDTSGGPEVPGFFEGFAASVINDFESLFEAAGEACPADSISDSWAARGSVLREAKRKLADLGAPAVLLSGSGSALAAFVESPERSSSLVELVKGAFPKGWFIAQARLLPEAPLVL